MRLPFLSKSDRTYVTVTHFKVSLGVSWSVSPVLNVNRGDQMYSLGACRPMRLDTDF
jgi:hypothetical protein